MKLTEIKHKERILKTAREKQQVTYKGNPIGLTADVSAKTLQAKREWQDIFKVLKGKNLPPRLLYLARISFKTGGEIKSFSDKQKFKNCTRDDGDLLIGWFSCLKIASTLKVY